MYTYFQGLLFLIGGNPLSPKWITASWRSATAVYRWFSYVCVIEVDVQKAVVVCSIHVCVAYDRCESQYTAHRARM
jgi:hypothetical protein